MLYQTFSVTVTLNFDSMSPISRRNEVWVQSIYPPSFNSIGSLTTEIYYWIWIAGKTHTQSDRHADWIWYSPKKGYRVELSTYDQTSCFVRALGAILMQTSTIHPIVWQIYVLLESNCNKGSKKHSENANTSTSMTIWWRKHFRQRL